MTKPISGARRVLIIGFGKSGKRLLGAFQYLAASGWPVTVVGICDSNPDIRSAVDPSLPFFDTAYQALRGTLADVVCVCVNEVAHHEILRLTKQHRENVELVISEKPLTRSIEEFHEIEKIYDSTPITVNFVERHSPVVRDFRAWLTSEHTQVHRVEFHWGKYRFRDARPTMGILSEISHPLDLVRFLIGQPADVPFNLVRATQLDSNFTCLPSVVPDTTYITYTLGGVLVNGFSSFLWPDRHREITIWSSSRAGAVTYQAVMWFDDKLWDQDRLAIYRLHPVTGEREQVFRSEYSNEDFPAELFQINKVAQFVADSLSVLEDQPSNIVARTADAHWVQHALDSIEESDTRVMPPLMFARTHHKETVSE